MSRDANKAKDPFLPFLVAYTDLDARDWAFICLSIQSVLDPHEAINSHFCADSIQRWLCIGPELDDRQVPMEEFKT